MLFCGWLLRYTEWFEVFGGLLALGGLASWLAFAVKVLPEDRLEKLQVDFCDRLFVHLGSTIVAGAWLCLTAALFLGFGTIQIESFQQIGGDVWIVRSGEGDDDPHPLTLAPGQTRRAVRWAPFYKKTSFDLRVSGLPRTQIAVGPFTRRVEVKLPYSYRPSVLIAVDATTLGVITTGRDQSKKYRMELTVDKKRHTLEDYAGEAVLVGAALPFDVPLHIRDEWADELNTAAAAAKLLEPRTVDDVGLLRHRGSVVSVEVFQKGRNTPTFQAGPIAVRPVVSLEDIVQPLLVK